MSKEEGVLPTISDFPFKEGLDVEPEKGRGKKFSLPQDARGGILPRLAVSGRKQGKEGGRFSAGFKVNGGRRRRRYWGRKGRPVHENFFRSKGLARFSAGGRGKAPFFPHSSGREEKKTSLSLSGARRGRKGTNRTGGIFTCGERRSARGGEGGGDTTFYYLIH